jgi:N-acetylmuramoyl-L-alanine amidase
MRNVKFSTRFLKSAVVAAFFVSAAPWALHPAQAGNVVASAFALEGDEMLTRFEATLSDDVGYTATVIPDPYRVMIDLAGVSFDIPPGAGRKGKGLVKSIRYGNVEKGKSRIVIDTTGPVLITQSRLEPATGKSPAKVLVELMSIPEDVFKAAFAKDNAPAAEEPTTTAKAEEPGDIVGSVTPAPAVVAKARPVAPKVNQDWVKPVRADGKKVIVLDPGHGGIDPGAISPGKTREKDVVLAFAATLRDALNDTGKFHVVLTREDDRFISLKDRVKRARAEGADLFMALHADIIRGQSATGTTLYTLSEKASDAEAEALAEKENRSDLIAGLTADAGEKAVADALLDLVKRESNTRSLSFAHAAAGELRQVTKMTGKAVRSAGFVVLRAPDVPSVLVELGFLSNPQDEERMGSPAWRKSLAQGFTRAMLKHFEQADAHVAASD